jgi:hypothetical protein
MKVSENTSINKGCGAPDAALFGANHPLRSAAAEEATMREFFHRAFATTIVVSGVAVFVLSPARAETVTLIAYFDAVSEVPSTNSEGTGTVVAKYDTGSRLLSWTGGFSGLAGDLTAARFYGPAGPGKNAGVAIPGPNASLEGSATLTDAHSEDLLVGYNYAEIDTTTDSGAEVRPNVSFEGRATLTETQAKDLLAGRYYVNVHTATNPGGEIRGQVIRFDQLWLSH